MRIGLDFDNTIVSYDSLFHKVAIEQGVVPEDTPVNKIAVRDYLRAIDQESIWTEMQGYVYGTRMSEAEAFPGLFDALDVLRAAGHELFIVSHKTKHPIIGEKHDLHAAASSWIAGNLQPPGRVLMPAENVFFELTKAEKIARIATLRCDFFVDDLPEILMADLFPDTTTRLLFDPEGHHGWDVSPSIGRVRNWREIPGWISARQ
jgi:hypothetical protein